MESSPAVCILPRGRLAGLVLRSSLALSCISAYSSNSFLIFRLAYRRFAIGSPACCGGWLKMLKSGMFILMMSAGTK